MKNSIIKPGDVAKINGKLYIYQGNLPQGGGDIILQFSNNKSNLGMNMEAFMEEGYIVPAEEAPAVIKNGLQYEFAK